MTTFAKVVIFKNKKNEQDPIILQRLVQRVNGKSDLAKLAAIAAIYSDRFDCHIGNYSNRLDIRSWQ